MVGNAFDIIVCLTLVWLAWHIMVCADIFTAIVLYISFGLLMALGWIRLQALDVALAEAAIGSGLSGALFLSALRRMARVRRGERRLDHGEERTSAGLDSKAQSRGLVSLLILAMLASLYGALAWGYLADGPQGVGLAHLVDTNLLESGVKSRVTAVLLNFRAYDTLLECFVLFLGVNAAWSLRPYRDEGSDAPLSSPVLAFLVRLLVPLMVLISGYLLWTGSSQAGGAFQAGAILGGAGVLLLLSSSPLLADLPKGLLAAAIALGPLAFLVAGVAAVALGDDLLEYRGQMATMVIIALEAVAALSIGLSLAALFGGRRPQCHVKKDACDGDGQSEGEA